MASPTELAGLKAKPITEPQHTPDGRRLHVFRQSSLKTVWEVCGERGRLEMSDLMPKTPSEATAIGTAVHLGAELTLLELRDTGNPLPLSAALEVAQQEFSELILEPGFRWVDKQENGARAAIDRCVTTWHTRVMPDLVPLQVEWSFGPLVLHEDDDRVIVFNGTVDYLDATGPYDWKTAGREYQRWEYQRWAVQPTVYVWALVEAGLLDPERPSWPFTFTVLLKDNGGLQTLTVDRHRGDFAWLKERSVDLAKLIEADLSGWQKVDSHALCSDKWCGNWSACKGAHFGPGWPKNNVPAEGVAVTIKL